MEKKTFKTIMDAVVVVCLVTAAMTFAVNGCKRMEQVNRYTEMVEQYDTTTMKNKMVLMPKIMNLADSISRK